VKKRLVLLLVLASLLVTVVPVAAAGPMTTNAAPPFSLAGTITAINTTAKTVTVKVLAGNYLIKPYLGKNLTVATTPATRFLRQASPVAVPITFADLKVGQNVSITGVVCNNVWTAYRITVGASLIHQ
jgi:hypothetical protein